MIKNKELNEMINKCKTAEELKNLQTQFANELIGKITDAQAIKILKAQRKLEENERKILNEKRQKQYN